MLVNGTIMRNGDRLFWSLNGKVVEVAQTYEWSTFPKWSSHYDIVQVHLQKTRGPLPEYYSASVSLSAN